MRSGAIPERFQQVTRVSLDNATILLQRSKCKKEDIIEKKQPPSAPSPPSMDVPDPMEITVKAAIAKSVAEQFRRAGRHVTGEELSKIVDAEYTKVGSISLSRAFASGPYPFLPAVKHAGQWII